MPKQWFRFFSVADQIKFALVKDTISQFFWGNSRKCQIRHTTITPSTCTYEAECADWLGVSRRLRAKGCRYGTDYIHVAFGNMRGFYVRGSHERIVDDRLVDKSDEDANEPHRPGHFIEIRPR